MFMRRYAPRWGRVSVGLVSAVLLVVCPAPAAGASIGLNFTGVGLFDGQYLNGGQGYAPPDNSGGVGPDTIVQLINGAYVVFNKSNGVPTQFKSGKQFWIDAGVDPGTGPGVTNLGAFNQRILYDPTADRWIAAALSGASENNSVLLARSETSNPTGAWKAVSFVGNVGGEGNFADFTRLGVDANGVYIATSNFAGLEGGYHSQSVFTVPKADLLATNPTLTNLTRFDAWSATLDYLGGESLQPIINFGTVGNHAPVLGVTFEATDTKLFRSDLMNTAAAGATLTTEFIPIQVASYTLPPKAAQPDGSRDISLIDARFKSPVSQVGNTIYAVHDVKVGNNAAIKWYKINEATSLVIQEGILSDPNFDYYQASIAANANGDVVIGFNRSGMGTDDGQISIFAVHGTTVGNVTTFGAPMLLKASTVDDYHYGNTRWGDYTTTLVDPLDPNVFWTFQEYARYDDTLDQNYWATQITQIIVPEPASMALAAIALAAFAATAWRRRRR